MKQNKLISSVDYQSEILITLVLTTKPRRGERRGETVPVLHYVNGKRGIEREREREVEKERKEFRKANGVAKGSRAKETLNTF